MNVIETDSLTKRFGTFTAVDHISFEVGEGEIFGFLGANGAGKTTRCVCFADCRHPLPAKPVWQVLMYIRRPSRSNAISAI